MYAPALVFIGAWGLLLAALNMFSMAHPTQHVSWGVCSPLKPPTKPLEAQKTDSISNRSVTPSSSWYALPWWLSAPKPSVNASFSLVDWLKGLVVNDTWPALNDLSVGGGQRTFAAWCLALGLAFYFWFGIQHAGWIDVGVYSVTIALMASGFALNHASRVPPGDENID